MAIRNIKRLLSSESTEFGPIVQWINDEATFWEQLKPNLNNPGGLYDIEPLISYIALLQNQVEKLRSNPNTLDNLLTKKIVSFASEHHIPNHGHPIADDLIRLRNDLPRLEQTLITYKTCSSTIDSFFEEEYSTKYKNLIEDQSTEFTKQLDRYLKTNEKFVQSAAEVDKALTEHFESLKDAAKADLDSISQEKSTYLNAVAATIDANITSSEPVKFWESKRSTHADSARTFQWAAITLGSLACIILFFLVLAAFKDQDTTELLGFKLPNHFYMATCLLVGSAFVWALRISIQLIMTHMALEAEAFEKSTAIKTYVALSGRNIDSDIEKDFHRALLTFNKIKIADESNSPEIIKILESLLSKKPSS